MGLRDVLFARLARQLGGPHGLTGRLLARRLNRFNERSVTAAVDLLDPAMGSTVADIGFGGGIGLGLLAERVGSAGLVHGIDPMTDMVRRAERVHARLVAEGRLELHAVTADRMPLPNGALDRSITCNTVYFWPEPAPSLIEVVRVTRPGGVVVIGMADPSYFASRPFEEHGFHVREVAEVSDALEGAGFAGVTDEPVDIGRTIFHLLRAERA